MIIFQQSFPTMTTNQSTSVDRYHIFLLTCWLDDTEICDDPETWRFRLEDPRTGQLRGCVGLSALMALLEDKIVDEAMSKKHEKD